jgi:hypothetical protein
MEKRLTIKAVAQATGVSQHAIRDNVERLLSTLPLEDRMIVMEYMVYCKSLKSRREPSDDAAPDRQSPIRQ